MPFRSDGARECEKTTNVVGAKLTETVEVRQRGQIIAHSIGAGGILRIVPPKKGETRVAGK